MSALDAIIGETREDYTCGTHALTPVVIIGLTATSGGPLSWAWRRDERKLKDVVEGFGSYYSFGVVVRIPLKSYGLFVLLRVETEGAG